MRCLRTVQVTLPRAESRLQEGSLMCCCMRKLSLTNIRGILASSSTARRSRKQQGWSLQLLSIACWFLTPRKPSGDTFQNMIFSNECSISLQSHSRRCFRMADKPTKRKPKPKHPLNVHVWGGISRRGATRFCIFDGIMDADLYAMFLRRRSFHLLEINFPSTSSCRTVTRRIRPCECKLSSGDQFT